MKSMLNTIQLLNILGQFQKSDPDKDYLATTAKPGVSTVCCGTPSLYWPFNSPFAHTQEVHWHACPIHNFLWCHSILPMICWLKCWRYRLSASASPDPGGCMDKMAISGSVSFGYTLSMLASQSHAFGNRYATTSLWQLTHYCNNTSVNMLLPKYVCPSGQTDNCCLIFTCQFSLITFLGHMLGQLWYACHTMWILVHVRLIEEHGIGPMSGGWFSLVL